MSYTRVVVYTLHPGKADEAITKGRQGLSPTMQRMRGFHSYHIVKVSDAELISISVFDTQAQANTAVSQMAAWVKANITQLVVSARTYVGEYLDMTTGVATGVTPGVTVGPTAQKVLDYLRQQRGTAFAASDVCEIVDCSTGQAQIALDTLADAGLIARQGSTVGTTTYVLRNE